MDNSTTPNNPARRKNKWQTRLKERQKKTEKKYGINFKEVLLWTRIFLEGFHSIGFVQIYPKDADQVSNAFHISGVTKLDCI
jgi:hypothetical protein